MLHHNVLLRIKACEIVKQNVISTDISILLMATSGLYFFDQHFISHTAKMNWAIYKTAKALHFMHYPALDEEMHQLNLLTKLNFRLARHSDAINILHSIEQENPYWKYEIDNALQKISQPTNRIEKTWEKNLIQNKHEQIKQVLSLEGQLKTLAETFSNHNQSSNRAKAAAHAQLLTAVKEIKLNEILLTDVIKLKATLYPAYQPTEQDLYWHELQAQHQRGETLYAQQAQFETGVELQSEAVLTSNSIDMPSLYFQHAVY